MDRENLASGKQSVNYRGRPWGGWGGGGWGGGGWGGGGWGGSPYGGWGEVLRLLAAVVQDGKVTANLAGPALCWGLTASLYPHAVCVSHFAFPQVEEVIAAPKLKLRSASCVGRC